MNERRGASVSCITRQATVDGPSSHQRPTTPPPHLFGLLSTVFGYLMVWDAMLDAGRCPEARCNVSQNTDEICDWSSSCWMCKTPNIKHWAVSQVWLVIFSPLTVSADNTNNSFWFKPKRFLLSTVQLPLFFCFIPPSMGTFFPPSLPRSPFWSPTVSLHLQTGGRPRGVLRAHLLNMHHACLSVCQPQKCHWCPPPSSHRALFVSFATTNGLSSPCTITAHSL